MSNEQRMRVYDAVDLIAPKSKSKLFLVIKAYMEKENITDPFSEKTVTVHKAPEAECESCSA